MSRILIKGHFIDHGRPDGDSIRFAVDAKQQWRIRLEAIDALETHYQPRGKSLHGRQPAAEGDAAASALQKFLGITDVDTKAPGYIIRNDGTDSKGRVVAFAFAGRTRIGHGSTVEITDDVLKNRDGILQIIIEQSESPLPNPPHNFKGGGNAQYSRYVSLDEKLLTEPITNTGEKNG